MSKRFSPQKIGDSPDKQGIVEVLYQIVKKMSNVDFIVIIQKLGSKSSYLVTSFYIDKNYNKKIYQKRYENYLSNNDKKLVNCEWF